MQLIFTETFFLVFDSQAVRHPDRSLLTDYQEKQWPFFLTDFLTDFCIFLVLLVSGESFGVAQAIRPVHTETIMKGLS